MNLKLFVIFLFINIIDGFILKPMPLINKKPLLNSYGGYGGNNNIFYGGNGGGNDDDDDINLFYSLIILNLCMIKTTYKNNYLFDLFLYNNK